VCRGRQEVIVLDKAFLLQHIRNTVAYKSLPSFPPPLKKHKPSTPLAEASSQQVTVWEADCVEVAIHLQQLGLSPCALNMANAGQPGGGYKSGNGAQEEVCLLCLHYSNASVFCFVLS